MELSNVNGIESVSLEDTDGTLLSLRPGQEKYTAKIWFRYYRELIHNIEEGDLIAIENFRSSDNEKRYTILEVTQVYPKHYALDEGVLKKSYPSFSLDAAETASEDWMSQMEENVDASTLIDVEAEPMKYNLVIDEDGADFEEESDKPMVGSEVFVLEPEFVGELYNRELEGSGEKLGDLEKDEEVDIDVDYERLIRYHCGVFAFTGGGKSNLLSMLTRYILDNTDTKIVVFDLSGEYAGLLIDLLVEKDSQLLFLDEREYSEDPESLASRVLLPDPLTQYQDSFREKLGNLLQDDKVHILSEVGSSESYETFGDFWEEVREDWGDDDSKYVENVLLHVENEKSDEMDSEFDPEDTLEYFENLKNEDVYQYKGETVVDNTILKLRNMVEQGGQGEGENEIALSNFIDNLLQKSEGPELNVVSSSDAEDMREIVTEIFNRGLYERKLNPLEGEQILFILDEAHEYIPGTRYARKDDFTQQCSNAVENITRQGRKYRMGIMLATQRTRYLNTSIMGQLHTYLIGSLPRRSDREPIANASNLSLDILQQTVDFSPADWMITSHVSTGMKNVPIVVKTKNAEEILENYLLGG